MHQTGLVQVSALNRSSWSIITPRNVQVGVGFMTVLLIVIGGLGVGAVLALFCGLGICRREAHISAVLLSLNSAWCDWLQDRAPPSLSIMLHSFLFASSKVAPLAMNAVSSMNPNPSWSFLLPASSISGAL